MTIRRLNKSLHHTGAAVFISEPTVSTALICDNVFVRAGLHRTHADLYGSDELQALRHASVIIHLDEMLLSSSWIILPELQRIPSLNPQEPGG